MVKVLQTDLYVMKFYTPQNSRHEIIKSKFLPLRKIWQPLWGLGIWIPTFKGYNLIHTFNYVPLTCKPWIVTFEGELPRTIGDRQGYLKRFLRQRLTQSNCRKIIALSDYAKFKFMNYNADWLLLDEALRKLEVIHPFVQLRSDCPKVYNSQEPLQLLFVGNDFARKGGITALRLAKKAKKQGVPIIVHIVSRMNYGASVYTDHPQQELYEPDLELLKLDNVIFHGKQPNSVVLELMQKCHFHILMSLHDTYGLSVIEGFSLGTPAIATNVCALPEIVHHQKNGFVIPLELEKREWVDLGRRQASQEYWEILDRIYEDLADRTLQTLVTEIVEHPQNYELLSAGALHQAKTVHNAGITSEWFDNLYEQAVRVRR